MPLNSVTMLHAGLEVGAGASRSRGVFLHGLLHPAKSNVEVKTFLGL